MAIRWVTNRLNSQVGNTNVGITQGNVQGTTNEGNVWQAGVYCPSRRSRFVFAHSVEVSARLNSFKS